MRRLRTRRGIETMAAALLALIAGVAGIAGREQRLGPKFLALEKIGTFKAPVYVTQPRGGSLLFVVEKAGVIRAVGPEGVVRGAFLDVRELVKESGAPGRGLVSLAFPPGYASSGLFYVSYVDRDDDLRVVEYRRSSGSFVRADPSSARDVLTVPGFAAPQGGAMAFGPDRRLYIATGDGGPSSGEVSDVSQDPTVLQGKLLRITPKPSLQVSRDGDRRPYRIPKDNPFVGIPGRDEIYSLGLHDPWRFSFDRATGALTVGDARNDGYQEFDYATPGGGRAANFGWPAYAGFRRLEGGLPRSEAIFPNLVYARKRGCQVIGGYVVRDRSLTRIAGRELVGRYLFADYCSGRVFAAVPHLRRASKARRLRWKLPRLISFGEDASGRIYFVSEAGGVWRLVPERKRN